MYNLELSGNNTMYTIHKSDIIDAINKAVNDTEKSASSPTIQERTKLLNDIFLSGKVHVLLNLLHDIGTIDDFVELAEATDKLRKDLIERSQAIYRI